MQCVPGLWKQVLFPKYRHSTTGEPKGTRICPKKLVDVFNVPDNSILLMTGPFHLSGPIKNLSSKSSFGHTSQEGTE